MGINKKLYSDCPPNIKKTSNNTWVLPFISILAGFFVIGFWLFNWYYLESNVDRGTFGDMFGFANSLFSGLAFIGIIVTILLQGKELSLQRKELADTREVFRLQRFENTFFNLLSLHHQIVDEMYVRRNRNPEDPDFNKKKDDLDRKEGVLSTVEIKGRDIFRDRFLFLKDSFKKNQDNSVLAYEIAFKEVHVHFGHYFRNLYRIIKLVDKTQFFDGEESSAIKFNNDSIKIQEENYKLRYKYTSMVRAQLSDYELAWLYYNGLSVRALGTFKPLIEKYSLLKNLPKELLINDVEESTPYEDSAFEKISIVKN
ncbi:MAG: putative phage abortive infection protein [Vicingaceae bacterium]